MTRSFAQSPTSHIFAQPIDFGPLGSALSGAQCGSQLGANARTNVDSFWSQQQRQLGKPLSACFGRPLVSVYSAQPTWLSTLDFGPSSSPDIRPSIRRISARSSRLGSLWLGLFGSAQLDWPIRIGSYASAPFARSTWFRQHDSVHLGSAYTARRISPARPTRLSPPCAHLFFEFRHLSSAQVNSTRPTLLVLGSPNFARLTRPTH